MPRVGRALGDVLTSRDGRIGALAVVLLTGLAAALRAPWWRSGWTPDEIGNLTPGGAWAVLTDSENAVNPPLWRLVASLAGDGGEAIQLGRAVAIGCGVLAVPAAYAVGRRAGGILAGTIAATALAVLPVLVDVGTLHRAYAAWVLAALVVQLGLVAGLGGDRRGWWVAAVGGALLAQLHYLAVPVLTLLAVATGVRQRSWRLAVALLLPAAVVLLPWADLIVAGSERRLASPDSPEATVVRLASLGLQVPPDVVKAINGPLRSLGLDPPTSQRWTGLAVLAVLAGHLPVLHRLAPARQVAWIGAVGVLAASWVAAHGQYVRPHAQAQLAAFLVPLLASVGSGIRRVPWRAAVAVLVVLALGLRWPAELGRTLANLAQRESLPHFAAHMRPLAEGRPISVHSRFAAGWLYTVVTGRPAAAYDHLGPCGNARDCYAHGDLVWRGVDARPPGPCLLASFERKRPPDLGAGCRSIVDTPGYAVWRCD